MKELNAFRKYLNEARVLEPGNNPIVTNKQGEEFVLQGFVTSGYYLIPYDGSEYWEHFQVPKSTWISTDKVKWDDYDYSQNEFNNLLKSHGVELEKINQKFKDSSLKEGYSQSDFDKLEDALYHGDIPGQLILQGDGALDLLLGRDYPDSLADKADAFARKLGIDMGIMAQGAFRVPNLDSSMINGGPEEWDGDEDDDEDDEDYEY